MSLPLSAFGRPLLNLARSRAGTGAAIASSSRTLIITPVRLQQNDETPARSHRPRSASQHPSQLLSKAESQGVSPDTGLETARLNQGTATGNSATERNEQTYTDAKEKLDEFAQQLGSRFDPNAAAGTATTVASTPTTAAEGGTAAGAAAGASGGSVFMSPHAAPAAPASTLIPQAYAPDALPPRADPLLSFLTNLLMKSGKKAQAERFVTHALANIRTLTNADPLPLFYSAVEQVRPLVKMQSRKQGGKNLQVPIALTQRQSERKALMWIIEASKKRSDREISARLAKEIVAIVEGASSVNARKEEQHKIATLNRANASVRI